MPIVCIPIEGAIQSPIPGEKDRDEPPIKPFIRLKIDRAVSVSEARQTSRVVLSVQNFSQRTMFLFYDLVRRERMRMTRKAKTITKRTAATIRVGSI
jgi:hypothetical protein